MTELRDLLEDLRRGGRPPLSVDAVELLLGWLTGSAAREGGSDSELPRPGHDPVLLQMVLHRLDDVLFDGGELRPAAAGLDPEEPATRRRIRFRRLASAFHPDRFPDLADWLTQRSQAVHRAYARFKQDPDAPVVAPAPRPGPYPQQSPGRKVRPAAPRVRKHRLRAFANNLRARFGNDRYLAHKLIGGLAVLALLPVLNMVLVPGKGTVDRGETTVDGERFTVYAGNDQRVGRGGIPDEEPVGRGGTPDEDNPTEKQADRDGSLARQAPTPVEGSAAGQGPESGTDASTDAGAGLAGDDRGPENPIAATPAETAEPDAPARKPSTVKRQSSSSTTEPEISPLLAAARRAMNPDGEIATVAALQTVDEQLAAMGLEDDTERLYRRIGSDETVDGERFTADADKAQRVGRGGIPDGDNRTEKQAERDDSLAGQAPTPAADSEPAAESVGAASSRDDRGPEVRIAANQTETADSDAPARKPSTGNRQPGPEALEPGNRKPVPSAQDAPPTADIGEQEEQRVGRGGIPDGDNRTEKQAERDDSLAGQAPTPAADSEPAAPTEPTTNNQQPTANQPPSEPAAGALVLGPLGRHPAGEVLQRFHAAMQAGNIAGVAGSFAPDARMGSLRGRDRIADHFRSALNPADSRQVDLKVLRLGREDGGWRVEAELEVRVDRSGGRENLLAGRSSFLLAGSGDQLLITRMEVE